MTVYLYDLTGEWLAFRTGTESRYLFSPEGDWIGWLPWDDGEVLTPEGDYLGTVVADRLVRALGHRPRGMPNYPGEPCFPGVPAYPGAAGYLGSIGGYEDLFARPIGA